MLTPGGDDRVHALLKRLGFHLWHPALESRDAEGRWLLLRGLEEFREHLGGELTITLLRDIGVGEEVHQMDVHEIRRALAWLRRREVGTLNLGAGVHLTYCSNIHPGSRGPKCAPISASMCWRCATDWRPTAISAWA